MDHPDLPHRSAAPALLATDLDGTLAVAGRISEWNRRAAAELKAAGVPILVVTGRNLRSLGRTAEVWDVADSVLFSSGSGLASARDAEPRERHRLGGHEVMELSSILDRHGEDYCLLDPVPRTHHFAWKRHRPSNPDFDARMAIYEEYGRRWSAGDAAVTEGACQVLVIRPAGTPANPELEQELSRWSVFHSSSPIDHVSTWLEVFPEGMDKGSALAEWCRDREIPASRVLALGNDFNDMSMLEWSGYPRVVGNAPDPLKKRFTVLPPADQDGFSVAADEAMQLFGQDSRTW